VKLAQQVALITGASRGLGLSIAKALGAEGAAIGCVARAGAELDGAVATLRAAGIDAFAAAADVTSEAAVAAATRAVIDRGKRLDIVVLNAGAWQGAPLHETSEAMWDLLIDLNLKGAFLTLKHTLPTLRAQRRGTVIGIGSIGGLVGMSGSAAYAASKWGLHGLLESAALEAKADRVRVSHVAPHNMNSAGRAIEPGTPERDRHLETSEVASLVAWICSAPDHVAVGTATIWPLAAGIAMK
jgi:NADP-dependent 3-hydroxy acid dehydrogenase YdfG